MAKLRNISRSDVEAWPQQTSLRRLRCLLKSALNTLGALRDGREAQHKLVNFELLRVNPRYYPKFALHRVLIIKRIAANIFFISKEFQKTRSSSNDLVRMKGCFGSLTDA